MITSHDLAMASLPQAGKVTRAGRRLGLQSLLEMTHMLVATLN